MGCALRALACKLSVRATEMLCTWTCRPVALSESACYRRDQPSHPRPLSRLCTGAGPSSGLEGYGGPPLGPGARVKAARASQLQAPFLAGGPARTQCTRRRVKIASAPPAQARPFTPQPAQLRRKADQICLPPAVHHSLQTRLASTCNKHT